MKIVSKVLTTVVLFAFVNIVANAQSGPIQWISNSEFDEMVQSGELKLATPHILEGQSLQILARYLRNQAVVEDFLRQNPNLPGLAGLVAATPSPNDPNVTLNPNGDYYAAIVDSNGASQVVQTMGQGTKLAQLASSIQASSDPQIQLQIYTALYNQLPQAFLNGGGGDPAPISPSQLQGASLATIKNAIHALVSQWATIVSLLPPPVPTVPVACNAEVGASPTADNEYYGDQSTMFLTPGCETPSPTGILANFDFPSKGLLTCVKNQGYRGTCGIFAATSAIEELVARDMGVMVNLSEQDWWENVKLNFDPDYYGDGEDPGYALHVSAENGYQFGYENQWDYNPSWSQPTCTGCYEYVDTCSHYPLTEPGCSWSAPQAPEFCTVEPLVAVCAFSTAVLSGPRAPYPVPTQVFNIWNPGTFCFGCTPGVAPYPDMSVQEMILFLADNDAVILGFNVTNDFGNYAYVWSDLKPKERLADASTSTGGHNVHVVGYVSNEDLAATIPSAPPGPGGGYFIIKNSWGLCAGDAGYYYMPVEYLKKEAQAIYVVSSLVTID